VALCHTPGYIETARRDIESGAFCLSTGDTNVSEKSFKTALFAVGGAIVAVDAVVEGRAGNAFCVVRPPGHHATRTHGMGFCVFNNIAVAARYAQKEYGLQRILIVDWDVHHGNGTQDIFYDDPSVFYFSTHQWPLYPGTGAAGEQGAGPGLGTNLNCPMAAGSCGRDLRSAFNDKLVPAMKTFKPELILISAGFDARMGDPVGGMMLNDQDYSDLTSIVLVLAREFADDRIVSVLEGGYDMAGLARASAAHVSKMAGREWRRPQ
jgi:acetoin utilization deacetylase AcuC-like enzyme